ncbi:MAG TPA: 50S ribosomal protein L10 [Candidatus Saccharimonadales bacterium]|nr:50S ribosomal protein L10 [Candidatus Saccharimonadales bacterium]
MALTKDKKQEIVAEVANLLSASKMTVIAAYPGTTVQAIQQLRRSGKATNTQVRVVKNRLVIKALQQIEHLKGVDTSSLAGQLLYAFNPEDEVAPAQTLAQFAKSNNSLQFIGAISADGSLLSTDDVKALAALPSKEQLRAQLLGTIAAPLSGFTRVLSGNLRGLLYVLQAKAEISQ